MILMSSLSQAFLVTDLGQLKYFLSLQLDYLTNGLLISKRKYIYDLLKKPDMTGTNPISSPMFASTKLSKYDSPKFDNITLFWSIVGGL